MSQKIRIYCDACNESETYIGEKLIVFVWQHGRIGIITHDVDDKDIIEASKKLIQGIPNLTDPPSSN
jgi:hypothetical protein